MSENDTNFPLNIDSPLINFLQKVILISIKLLACFMTLTIVWSVLDVGIDLFRKAIEPPFLFIHIEELLASMGSFLVVLIAVEIFVNILLYLRKDMGHLKLVVATALMAIARKIIIMDYDHVSSWTLLAMGVVIVALGIAYWLIHNSHQPRHIQTNLIGESNT